jgi:hypothetical protein
MDVKSSLTLKEGRKLGMCGNRVLRKGKTGALRKLPNE